MEPIMLFFYGIGGFVLHEFWTGYFGTHVCNMAVEYCHEECMESDEFVVIQ